MSLETDLIAALQSECPRTFPKRVPHGTALPYVVWEHTGGPSLRFLDNTAPDKRQVYIQVTAWAQTAKAAMDLLRAIEERVCSSTAFQASAQGEPVPAFDDGDELDGYLQAFSILGDRT
ncbi:MAG: DUF3168 domain-containing protein [Pseudorhodoferax sp.]